MRGDAYIFPWGWTAPPGVLEKPVQTGAIYVRYAIMLWFPCGVCIFFFACTYDGVLFVLFVLSLFRKGAFFFLLVVLFSFFLELI